MISMSELQEILSGWLGYFFSDGRYRLVEIDPDGTSGYDFIAWASDILIWRLSSHRFQVLLEYRPVTGKDDDWYTTDLLVRLIFGKRVSSSTLTKEVTEWIEQNLVDIESRFSEERLSATMRELQELERIRGKELFG